MRTVILGLFLAVLLPISAFATTWYITPDGSGDAPTIQAGVDSAASGDTVLVAAGAYGENIDLLGKALTIRGESGAEATIIDGSLGPAPPESTFVIRMINLPEPGAVIEDLAITNPTVEEYGPHLWNGAGVRSEASTLAIRNCIFRNCYATRGAALFAAGSSLNVQGCVFEENGADQGGAIFLGESEGTIESCSFRDNGEFWGTMFGGAVWIWVCNHAIISNCTFESNVGEMGAGVTGDHSTHLDVVDCTFEGNQGGAVAANYGSMTVTSCLFSNNMGTHGGAFLVYEADALLEDCLFVNNSTTRNGAAVSSWNTDPGSYWRLARCTFAGNSAVQSGGAIAARRSTLGSIDSCTIYSNSAEDGGGAVFVDPYSELTIHSSIIVANQGGGVWREQGGLIVFICNDVWNNASGDYIGCQPGAGDFSEDPIFCNPATLDFRLDAHSPCVQGYGCGRLGAWGVGCGATNAISTTWGKMKILYQ